jgi:VWFA-related protein
VAVVRTSALLLLAGLAMPQQPAFRSEIALVRLDVEVRHNGQPVEELPREDFEVFDNGERREIVHFGYREEPLDLVLLFDTSLSMQPVVERIAQTGRAALRELHSGDRVAVMAFSNGTDLILDFTEQFDAVEGAVQRVLRRPFIPSSELQGGIDDAAQHFLKQPRSNRRRAILAISDGLGNGRARDAVKNLWEADAVVSGMLVRNAGMTVIFRTVRPDSMFSGGMGGIADDTGGDAVKFKDAAEGLRQMLRRLRLRYSLAYAMPAGKPGEQREIRVRLEPGIAKRYPKAQLRARTGYFVPASR